MKLLEMRAEKTAATSSLVGGYEPVTPSFRLPLRKPARSSVT